MSKRKHADSASASASAEDSRAFPNPYPPWDGKSRTNVMPDGKLAEPFRKSLHDAIGHLTGQMEAGLRKNTDENDQSVYTGVTGISLLYLHLHQALKSETHLSKCHQFIERPLRHLKGRRVTFMCGDAGPLAVGALVYRAMGRQVEMQDCINKLQALHSLALDPSLPDELLYGRAGYLYALLFIKKHLGAESIDSTIIDKVCRCILDSGQRLARRERSEAPLMFEWHEKKYIGAAHGMSGIMAVLLQADCPSVTSSLQSLIQPTVDYLLGLRFSSGNFPSSLGNATDRLVHWCHGAPGVVHMLLQAHKVFKDDKYLKAAEDSGRVVWERGLLRKGYGLCHGSAGNGYAFVALYQATGAVKYLYYASKFAEWCMDYGKHGCRIADRPYSLMEGMAGTIYFLSDLLSPHEARFPGLYIT